ncbi:ATP synthase subunit delta [Gossypium arboreum]|uniref:ATP synthase subunit delta n=1 Tax=Gossypium arboreum TaxID=29729 RepID=A0A0B0PRT4_GOSAR|nr:ATP synthase subunit delta [Gossypium arboreum]
MSNNFLLDAIMDRVGYSFLLVSLAATRFRCFLMQPVYIGRYEVSSSSAQYVSIFLLLSAFRKALVNLATEGENSYIFLLGSYALILDCLCQLLYPENTYALILDCLCQLLYTENK